jgi:Ca2+/Na+ antiporter
MKAAIAVVMFSNATLFFFGALQHAGVALGPFHEPYILPAAIVETICGVALVAGGTALGGVLLGRAALAAGRGPRTSSNDLYHNIMLVLIGIAIVLLVAARAAYHRNQRGSCPFSSSLKAAN